MDTQERSMIPPEPPKDENGNPMAPPEGGRPPMGERPAPQGESNSPDISTDETAENTEA